GQAELPILRQLVRSVAEFGKPLAERLCFAKVDVTHGVVVPLGQLRCQFARQLSDDPFPLPLRCLVLGHPEAFAQSHLDLIFARTAFGFVGRATHGEFARRAPANLDAGDLALVTCLRAIEGGGDGRRSWLIQHRYRLDTLAAEHCGREQNEEAKSSRERHDNDSTVERKFSLSPRPCQTATPALSSPSPRTTFASP